jgi:hypothetical protein
VVCGDPGTGEVDEAAMADVGCGTWALAPGAAGGTTGVKLETFGATYELDGRADSSGGRGCVGSSAPSGTAASAGFSESGSCEPVVFSVMVFSFSNRGKHVAAGWTFDRPCL